MWERMVGLSTKCIEPLEEAKSKEKDATKFVQRLEKDRRERERIRKLRADENQLRIQEQLDKFATI